MKDIPSFFMRLIPRSWFQFYKDTFRKKNRFKGMRRSDVFEQIYKTNHWGEDESVSGIGSTTDQTRHIIASIEQVFARYKIRSVADIPCGDYNWMQYVKKEGIQYTGGDIVPQIVEANQKKYGNPPHIEFKVIDLVADEVPQCDLIFCRDCLVHLSFTDIKLALNNIKKSKARYLLTTSFLKHPMNYDIPTGEWRTLNLQEKPFSFPKPLHTIDENCREENGRFTDKSLCLWEISKLSSYVV